MSISVGTRFGAYEVAALIGVGGMGEVYRARDPVLKRSVALKVLSESFVGDTNRVARLQREAEMLASLNHGNVAHVYGLEHSGGTTALVMELIEGPTLAERIAQGRIPVEEALRIAMQIADALEAAHERGVVHRDLKPANIKIRPDGAVKVLDFGIAKALDTTTTASGPGALTTPARTEGIVLGTAAYMSPEQARGQPTDERTDIWAFACVLYEMLTGKAAFLGEDITSTLARVLERDPDLRLLPATVSPAVRRTLELCFEKDPRRRLRHISDARLALAGRFAIDTPRQSPWRRAAAAAVLAAGALLLGVYLENQRSARDVAAPAEPVAPSISRFLIAPPAAPPIASQNGVDLAISRDGKRIAYWSPRLGTNDVELYVRDLDALEARLVAGTAAVSGVSGGHSFSPDGTSVVHHRVDGLLYVAAIDGQPIVKLNDELPPSGFRGGWWAPDDTVVYSAGARLWRVSADGPPTPLTPPREGTVGMPVLLPDGRAVLFHAAEGGVDRVEALDLETGQIKTVIEGASNPAYVDTGHLIFGRGDRLMAVPFDAAELAVRGEAVALVQGIRRSADGADYAISANGTLAYVPGTADTGSAVVWVDRGGNVLGRAVPDLVPSPRNPRLSPAGDRLLLRIGAAGDRDLWSYDLSGRPPIPLAVLEEIGLAVWSPDGLRIAFMARGNGGVMTLAADGSEGTPRPLRMPTLSGFFPAWWAAGELFLVGFPSGRHADIVATPAAPTGDIRNVAASDAFEFDPSLSPDGKWLAYTSTRTGRAEVWVQAYPEGVPVRRVSNDSGTEPLWSADGKELFFLQDEELMSAAVEAGTELSFAPPKPLFSGPHTQFPGGGEGSYDVARDGRFVMILPESESREAASAAGIVVVQNFGAELEQRVRPSAK